MYDGVIAAPRPSFNSSSFFFSSRRRHTILQGDWSSDVCSSDLSAERNAMPLPAGTWSAPFDLYWDVFHPLALNPEEPTANSFGDDIGDIYLDLKRGLDRKSVV